jgi:dienelactone hydrolase
LSIPSSFSDWDGVNEYEQVRATMIAQEWGYVGFAADIYGVDPQFVANMTERGQLATFYRSNPDIFGDRIRAAIDYVKAHPKVDPEKIAVFGYCFGGTGVLQYGLYGNDDVNSIVSFHGGLSFLPEDPLPFGPKLLVLSGGEDDAVTDIMDLEITLDTVEAPWEITRFSKIEHAFTVFEDGTTSSLVDEHKNENLLTISYTSFVRCALLLLQTATVPGLSSVLGSRHMSLLRKALV